MRTIVNNSKNVVKILLIDTSTRCIGKIKEIEPNTKIQITDKVDEIRILD